MLNTGKSYTKQFHHIKIMINSRAKGARGERQWRDELRAQGGREMSDDIYRTRRPSDEPDNDDYE